jgi:hypothetical protein
MECGRFVHNFLGDTYIDGNRPAESRLAVASERVRPWHVRERL